MAKMTNDTINRAAKMGWDILENLLRKIIGGFFNIKWPESKWTTFFQFIKFAMVGCTNVMVAYLINISTLRLLSPLQLRFDYVAANITAFLLSVLWSFYWNSRLVFTLEQGRTRSILKTLGKVYLSYAFTGIILNNILSTFWIHGLHISKYIAPLCNLPISVPINFLLNKLWAYAGKSKNEV